MATQQILWTALPWGRETADVPWHGQRRVSIVVSPRLTPQNSKEQRLEAFKEWLDWPATLAGIRFALEIAGDVVPLKVVSRPALEPDSALWQRLFPPTLWVAGFQFKDMSQVNLRSYPVRHVLGFVRRHYERLAVEAGSGEHPLLLPWRAADPALKSMLGELGTRTEWGAVGQRKGERLVPGFGRFHQRPERGHGPGPHERAVNKAVFNHASCIEAPIPWMGQQPDAHFRLRALPPDWEDPAHIRSGAIQVSPEDREARADLMARFSGPAEYAMWQADRFYRRTVPTQEQLRMKRPSMTGGAQPLSPPEFDFHQRVASYADHPNLLRRLGLVIDCVLETDSLIDHMLDSSEQAEGTMRLQLKSEDLHDPTGDVFMATAWLATKHRFVAAARTADHVGGLLRLQGVDDGFGVDPLQLHVLRQRSPFDIYQVDPDGAALKTVNFTLTAQNLVARSLAMGADGEVTYTTGDRQPVASLRSGGLGVSRHGRAGQVGMSAAGAAAIHQAIGAQGGRPRVTLYAEDLLRGYRVDVFDQQVGGWRSLCARQGDMKALPAGDDDAELPIDLPPDEGYVKSASTTGSDEAPDDHYLHETLFRWTGWSLVASRPGRTLRDATAPGSQMQTEEVVDVEDVAPSGNGIAVRYQPVKGSLPRLRFGRAYRMRARLVDLAGNSLALDAPDVGATEQSTEWVVYGRFEPLDPPPLALRRKLSEGESLERMVLRSNFDLSTRQYADEIAGSLARHYNSPDFEYGPTADRHMVPPKASLQTCELHSVFDAAIGSRDAVWIKAAYAIAGRENGSLMHAVPGAQIELITPSVSGGSATVQGAGALLEPPERADPARDRFTAGQYVVHREAIVPIPYLPDPACGGVALHGVPGLYRLLKGRPLKALAPGLFGAVIDRGMRVACVEGSKNWVLLLDMDAHTDDMDAAADWPEDMRSLRLELAEQEGETDAPPCGQQHTAADAPKWDPDRGVLRMFLPKGHIVRLRYACFVHDRLLDHFGLPRWQSVPENAVRLRAEAMAGANWMITPWRELTLVHATQQPVCEPRMELVSVVRTLGAHHADLQARQVHLHGPSTGQFEIHAEWEEWIDDPLNDDASSPGPRRVRHQTVLQEIRLHENHANVFALQDAVDAQTRFTPVGGQVLAHDVAERAAAPGNRHEFADARFRFVTYHLRATTRFREYLPPALFADASMIVRDGPPVTEHHVEVRTLPGHAVHDDPGASVLRVGAGAAGVAQGLIVPASAPPAVPETVIVLPTFRWERAVPTEDTLHSTRWGNGLRVYLERPWFSSGDGELLGVVIQGSDTEVNDGASPLAPYVTQWGSDPLWAGTRPTQVPRVADFPAGVVSDAVALMELGGGHSVVVVGHRVHFDLERKLWYCDIELNPGLAYMPFVRLALVRYQPNAIYGAKVSRVVLADFVQVLPRRKAVLQRRGLAWRLDVHGPVPERGPMRQHNPPGTWESEYANISFNPGFGAREQESGRNRMELVLQTRDASLPSDLAWEDTTVLASGPAMPGTQPAQVLAESTQGEVLKPRSDSSVSARSRTGETWRFDRMVAQLDVATSSDAALEPQGASHLAWDTVAEALELEIPHLLQRWDPPIWNVSVQIPQIAQGREGRLMVREFERFYTDRTVPERGSNAKLERIVVEERLVYADVFEL